jgi:putative ABC transport system permease protein
MTGLRGWRPSLKMAWRDARRSRARSILVLVMIALPVLGVTAADVVMQTSEVSGAEALDRRLGAADARLEVEAGVTDVQQGFDPDEASAWSGSNRAEPATMADVEAALGREVRGIERRTGSVRFTTDSGRGHAEVTEIDLGDPMASGLFELTSGRLPRTVDEVLVNDDLAARGPGSGEELELANGITRTIVGTAESTSFRGHPLAFGPVRAFGLREQRPGRSQTWLIEAGAVSWPEVRELNGLGISVLSRAVLEDPPPESELPAEIRSWAGGDDTIVAVAALVVAMALIEVVLLAGPAFAVGARRQSRNLALLAASGGTPRQARRLILASGIVLGGLGAALGVALGIGGAWAAMPLVQRFSNNFLGPFEVPWLHVLGIAAFGLVSAFLAAVVPAWIASRQDVVAVLAGRRGDRAPSRRSPILGVLVGGAGVAGAVHGARTPGGEFWIAGSAILAVLGMVLLIPVVVAGLARLSRRLPLNLRYAVRDAARHRTRTVPAVAAVAATVAGVVALGIANSSDEAQNRETYTAALPMGQASVTDYRRKADWESMRGVVESELPQARVREVSGLNGDVEFRADGHPFLLDGYGSPLGASVLVGEGALPMAVPDASDAEIAAAERMLARGGAVVLTSVSVEADQVEAVGQRRGPRDERPRRPNRVTVPATFIRVESEVAPVQAVVAPDALAGLGLTPRTVGLVVDGAEISGEQRKDVSEALGKVSRQASFYVERGYQPGDEAVILLLVLGALGGVLMIGGTLTATFLALSDARPDLATLSAVGASPRRRRGVAASYALVVGMVGAVLGAAVGFVPGIAVTYPLTSDLGGGGPFLDVPWLLIVSVVIVLPLFTALIVGLTARSRLPMVARLD